jgi:hypothetical protein
MGNENLIAVSEFCTAHQIEITFIESLAQQGLITIENVNEQLSIQDTQLPSLEKMVRLHYDLEINLEGIETIFHLLERIETLQHEMDELKKRIGLYE